MAKYLLPLPKAFLVLTILLLLLAVGLYRYHWTRLLVLDISTRSTGHVE
jgi:cell division protein FtsL